MEIMHDILLILQQPIDRGFAPHRFTQRFGRRQTIGFEEALMVDCPPSGISSTSAYRQQSVGRLEKE
jgi:hypothetical protein